MKNLPKVLLFGWLAAPQAFGGPLTSVLTISSDGTDTATANVPFNAKIRVFDSEFPNAMLHFHPMHLKPMHLIVVSEDLKTFAHLHPEQTSQHQGKFSIGLNQASADPDNIDAATAVSIPGRYFLYNETMPMGFSMTTLPLELKAEGPQRELEPLVLDPMNEQGEILKDIDGYRVRLRVETFIHCNSLSVAFDGHFQVWDPALSTFADITDLEPWLASFAHTVMISDVGTTAAEKFFYHLHATYPLADDPNSLRGPDVELGMHNHISMAEGVFKAWVQFKHRGAVHTFPFVMKIATPAPEEPGFEGPTDRSFAAESQLCL
jgi:hypothetical protein